MKNIRWGIDLNEDGGDDAFGLAMVKIHEGNAAAEQPIVAPLQASVCRWKLT